MIISSFLSRLCLFIAISILSISYCANDTYTQTEVIQDFYRVPGIAKKHETEVFDILKAANVEFHDYAYDHPVITDTMNTINKINFALCGVALGLG